MDRSRPGRLDRFPTGGVQRMPSSSTPSDTHRLAVVPDYARALVAAAMVSAFRVATPYTAASCWTSGTCAQKGCLV